MQDQTKSSRMEKADKRMYAPYKFSGMDYQFNSEVDKLNINTMREFTDNYFGKKNQLWIYKKIGKELADIKSDSCDANQEFDLVVKVLKVYEKDDFTLEMRIKDLSNELWFVTLPKLKFGKIKENDIVRLRSVQVNLLHKKNMLVCKPSTNVLKFTI